MNVPATVDYFIWCASDPGRMGCREYLCSFVDNIVYCRERHPLVG